MKISFIFFNLLDFLIYFRKELLKCSLFYLIYNQFLTSILHD